jgi:DNA polymerase III alpha subunit
MDAFGPTRSALMLELRLWRPQKAGRRSVGAALLTAQPTVAGGLEDLPLDRRRADQRRILGISVDEHPLRDHRSGLSEKTDADSRDLPRLVGRRVRIAGLLEALRVTRTRNGRTVRFFTFDDEWGLFEATAFAENSRIDDRMDADAAHGPDAAPAVVTGRVEDQYGFPIVAAERITWQE